MANPADTQTTNIVAVQGVFGPEPDFTLQYFVGPAGTPFLPPASGIIDGATIINSTIDSTVIGGSTPAAANFTNIETVTGQVTTLPLADNDIANKQYVDSVAQGLDIKAACAYTTTGNITLSGLATQAGGDWGSALTAGTRILVKNQTASAENGIYAASATGWTRTSDMNVWSEVPSAFTFIQQGTTLSDTGWVCTADPGGTIGVTAMPWTQFSGAGTYLAGNGLQIVGNTFSVKPNGTSLDASSSGLKISDTYAGQTSITTLGTIGTGVWHGSVVDVAYGGTGAATFSAGYLKANGTTAFTTVATIPNTDITGLGTMSTQDANNVAITGGSAAVSTLKTLGLTGYLYGNDTNAVTASTTIPNTAITGLGTMSTQNANNVAITGGTITGLTNLGTDYVQFNVAATVTPAVGKIWWDGGTTLNVGMTTNVVGRVAESLFTYVKASGAITKGDVVIQDGAVGASGVLKAKPAPLNTTNSVTILGIAAEDIALNSFGLIQTHGYLTGLNTTGSSVGETWADGDLLYYNPAYVGGLTNVKPTAPSIKLPMCEVVNAGSGGSGSLYVTIGASSVLGGTDSNVQFGTLSNGDMIQYNSTLGYWTNVATSTLSVGTATNLAGGGAGYIPYQSGAGATSFLSAGTSGQVLTSNGSSAPTWSTPTAYATVTDDTTTNATRYPLFANQTTGNLTTEYTASTKYQFNPSTGILTATGFSGSGANLTSLPAGQLSGTIPSAVLGNSTVYIGTTGIALNRASASQTLTGVSIDGSAGSATTATTATNANNVAVTDNTSTNSNYYVTYVTNTTGNLPITVASTKLQFNPSSGTLTATSFSGAGTGLTGTASSLSIGGTAANLAGGAAGSVPYQSGSGSTSFLAAGTSGQVLSTTGSSVQWIGASSLLDGISTTQGSILYRGASSWTALSPGTSGQALITNGAGANPSWGSVTVTNATPTAAGIVYGLTDNQTYSAPATITGTWFDNLTSTSIYTNISGDYNGQTGPSTIINNCKNGTIAVGKNLTIEMTSVATGLLVQVDAGPVTNIVIEGSDYGVTITFTNSINWNDYVHTGVIFGYKLIVNSLSVSGNKAENALLGYQAGNNLVTGGKNVILGAKAGASLINGVNNIVVGDAADASGDVSNEITLGNSSHTKTRLFGSLAVGGSSTGTSGQVLTSNGSSAPSWTSPAALTKTDDTNVTLTLGGSASTALLNAASITAGWTGQLATGRGGTGLSSYTAGDMLYYASGTALSKLAIGTSTYILTSSGTAPQWSAPSAVTIGSATNLAGGTAGALPYQTGAGATTFLSLGTTNYVLTAGASAPQYVAQSTLSVGSATNATNTAITDDTSTAADMYLTWVTSNTGSLPVKVTSTKLKFNPSTGVLTATGGAGGGTF